MSWYGQMTSTCVCVFTVSSWLALFKNKHESYYGSQNVSQNFLEKFFSEWCDLFASSSHVEIN